MKIKKSLTLDNWVCQEILRRFPVARKNFSAAVEGLLIAQINNPLAFWKHKAKYYAQQLQFAQSQVKLFDEMEKEKEKTGQSLAVRNKVIVEAIGHKHYENNEY